MRSPRNARLDRWKRILLAGTLCSLIPGALRAQMNMGPYFTAINSPLKKQSVMLMVLPDFQIARFGPNFVAGLIMAEYGITDRWTAGIMAEGQKISGMPATYGGQRLLASVPR